MKSYKENSNEEILKLKEELMSTNTSSGTNGNIAIKEIKGVFLQLRNEVIGKTFENNIREIFQEKFQCELSDINRILTFREVSIGEINLIVSKNFPREITLDSRNYSFSMEENGDLLLFNKTDNTSIKIDYNKWLNTDYHGKTLFISKIKEIEMDGAFKISNFSLNLFENKTALIHNGILNTDENPFEYIIIEAKLSKSKVLEMINQLKRDKSILSKMTKKRILYCGIINSKEIDIDITNNVYGFECIILGVINSYLCEKDVTQFYDWTLIKQCNRNTKAINELSNEIQNINSKLNAMNSTINSKFENMNSKIDKLYQLLEKKSKVNKDEKSDEDDDKDNNYLQRKRKCLK